MSNCECGDGSVSDMVGGVVSRSTSGVVCLV